MAGYMVFRPGEGVLYKPEVQHLVVPWLVLVLTTATAELVLTTAATVAVTNSDELSKPSYHDCGIVIVLV